jgi:hypothetical protein
MVDKRFRTLTQVGSTLIKKPIAIALIIAYEWKTKIPFDTKERYTKFLFHDAFDIFVLLDEKNIYIRFS